MKNIFKICIPVVLAFSLTNCNDRLEGDKILSTEALKIDSVKIAQDTMDVFSTQTIKTYSTYDAQCEGFYGYNYAHVAPLEREVATYKFNTSATCGDSFARASQINFRPQESGVYTFRFWTGEDSTGEGVWLEKTIVVE